MSSPVLFKTRHSYQRHFEKVAEHASEVWGEFLRIEKMSSQSGNNKPLWLADAEAYVPMQVAERYARIILNLSDPTAIESVINAAFSDLRPEALESLKTCLRERHVQAQDTLNSLNSSSIAIKGDAYIKVPNPQL